MRRAPGFLSNAHAGGTMEAFSPPIELQCEARRIFAASGLVYGTVDFLFANEGGSGFVVCELNANPGFEELERVLNIDVAAAIIASVNNTPGTNASINAVSSRTPGSGKDGTL
jgi:glutathione synthase/RimK-type ligase-like ATP-grasp enzyme